MTLLPVFPPHMKRASEKQKGQNWFIELLIFALVFLVISTAMSFFTLAGTITAIISEPDYKNLILSSVQKNPDGISDLLLSSDTVILFMLYSNIFMIGLTILFCLLLQKRDMASMGFIKNRIFTRYLSGLLTGFILFGAVTLINILTGSVRISGPASSFSPIFFAAFFFGFLIQGMGEEVLCRGYFLVSTGRRYSVILAIILNSAVFAALHLTNPGVNFIAVINLFLFGAALSVCFLIKGSIWEVSAIHSIWNFVQGNVFGMEVSGMQLSGSLLNSSVSADRTFWNGGSFGAEGGFSTTLVLCSYIVILLAVYRKKQRSSMTDRQNFQLS